MSKLRDELHKLEDMGSEGIRDALFPLDEHWDRRSVQLSMYLTPRVKFYCSVFGNVVQQTASPHTVFHYVFTRELDRVSLQEFPHIRSYLLRLEGVVT